MISDELNRATGLFEAQTPAWLCEFILETLLLVWSDRVCSLALLAHGFVSDNITKQLTLGAKYT
jgi:hypothetical protein